MERKYLRAHKAGSTGYHVVLPHGSSKSVLGESRVPGARSAILQGTYDRAAEGSMESSLAMAVDTPGDSRRMILHIIEREWATPGTRVMQYGDGAPAYGDYRR
jgi:hypothetical protein